jgi:hypothetical protein
MVLSDVYHFSFDNVYIPGKRLFCARAQMINCNVAPTLSEFCELVTWEYHIIFFGRKCVICIVELLCK